MDIFSAFLTRKPRARVMFFLRLRFVRTKEIKKNYHLWIYSRCLLLFFSLLFRLILRKIHERKRKWAQKLHLIDTKNGCITWKLDNSSSNTNMCGTPMNWIGLEVEQRRSRDAEREKNTERVAKSQRDNYDSDEIFEITPRISLTKAWHTLTHTRIDDWGEDHGICCHSYHTKKIIRWANECVAVFAIWYHAVYICVFSTLCFKNLHI